MTDFMPPTAPATQGAVFSASAPARVPHQATLEGFYTDNRADEFGSPAKWRLPVTFRPTIPWGFLNRVMASFSVVDGELAVNGLDLSRFLTSAATPESAEPLNSLLNDPDRALDTQTLAKLVMWLIERYNGRPTTA